MAGPTTRGRPPRLTPAVHDTIVAAVRSTGNLSGAAATAGVNAGTLRKWRRIGEAVNDPDHDDHPENPDAHERACGRLVAAVDLALDEFATRLRARIAEHAHTTRRTVTTTTRWIVVDGKPQQVVETKEVVAPPSLTAATYLLDRVDPPKQHVEHSGAVVLDLAERAARAAAAVRALRGIPPEDDAEERAEA